MWEAVREMSERPRSAGGALQRGNEELLVSCAWCGRYELGTEWIDGRDLPASSAVREKIDTAQITHSICPSCAERH
jgi:hypothetical protein